MLKKVFASFLAFCSTVTVCSATEYKSVQNILTENIYIEGKLDDYNGGQLTLRLYNGDTTCYIKEIEPSKIGEYALKFKFREDASKLKYDLKFNGVNVNDTVIHAYSDTASLISADIFLMDGNGGGLRIDGDTSRMTYTDVDFQTYPTEDKSVTNAYEVTDLEDYISVDTEVGVAVFPKNELGNDGIGYTVIIAQYDEDERLLGCEMLAANTMNYFDYKGGMVDCGKTKLLEGVKSVKAFMWDSITDIVPYTDAADGTLTPTNVYLVGDSISQRWDYDWMSVFPQAGIGSFLGDYFNPDYVTFSNKAVSGAKVSTYLDADPGLGDWSALMKVVKSGDYVIIALGANDFAASQSAEKKKEYRDGLEIMINDLLEVGATPILSQVIIHAYDGALTNGDPRCAASLEVLEELGKKYNLTVLDTGDTGRKIFIERGWTAKQLGDNYHLTVDGVKAIIGEDRYAKYYAKGKNTAFDGDPYEGDIENDSGHLNIYGADFYANIIADLIAQSDSPLKFYLK